MIAAVLFNRYFFMVMKIKMVKLSYQNFMTNFRGKCRLAG